MANVYDVLNERGFLKQVTHEGLYELLEKTSVTFYIGFDPTADSLHVGHYVQLMAMAHMQRAGHRPIVLLGGGTTMVGDPSGKADLRKMLSKKDIENNANAFKTQIGKFLDFGDGRALMINNADWLLELNYIEFLRDIGVHFSVNRMLTADCYKSRMEKGLTFLEFNYMLMQAYDFLVLNRDYGCKLQLGGDDQWSNILAGADLIRRKERKEAYGMTFALLLTSDGRKMGKTEKGAVWLDPEKTSPYDFYQYWRNVADSDVEKCLSLLTFLPMDKVRQLCRFDDERINDAKIALAYEVTRQVHGQEEADNAKKAAEALFSCEAQGGSIPETAVTDISGLLYVDLLQTCGLTASRGDGRRLIKQGGVSLNGEKVSDEFMEISKECFENGEMMIKKGKKVFHKVVYQR
ncbi:MAG: tyrosine--tRNA ligase [Eubacteriales bacterium]|nr:tyrosine--tRNA ligase [Eubacteriales bacterium]